MTVPSATSRAAAFVLAFAAVVLLAGWTTPYQAAGAAGRGFSDRQLAPGRHAVEFRADNETPADRLANMYLYRCAELTVQGGYEIFRSMASGAAGQAAVPAGPGRVAAGVIQMGRLADVPSNVRVWDARAVLRILEPVVRSPEGKAVPTAGLARAAMVPGRAAAGGSRVTLDDLEQLLDAPEARP